MSSSGLAWVARRSLRTLVTGTLHGIAVRRRAWRSKLRRLLGEPTPGAEHRRRQGTEVKLSDHALRDIGLTRMDLEVEPQGRSGGHELGQIAPDDSSDSA
jgi:hypothetical protein